MITNNQTNTNETGAGAAGIPADANIVIPESIVNFCNRLYPPHLGSAYDARRAHLVAKRLVIEGFTPLPCDLSTFIAGPAFAQLKQGLQTEQPTEKIAPENTRSATNVDSQLPAQISDPRQSATDPLQTDTQPQQPATDAQQSASEPQQSETNDLQLIADDYNDLLDKRSPLDQLTADQQDALHKLLQKQSLRDVAKWLAQPPPLGLDLKIHFTSLSRFAHRHAERKRILAQREKIQLAQQIVNASPDKDDGYSNAAIRLLHGRVLQATTDDQTNPDELKTLVATLNALRKQTLAERKFAAG